MQAYGGQKPTFNEFISPVGRVAHLYHDKPQLKFKDQLNTQPDIDPKTGIQIAEFKVTLVWPKAELNTTLVPMRQIAGKTLDEAWPVSQRPTNPATGQSMFILQPFLRDGDNPEHNTKSKEYLFGMLYLNFKRKADATKDAGGFVHYSGAPGLIGPSNEDILPVDLYPGSYARASGIMFGSEYMGKHFISVRLNNIQKARDGERIGGGGRPDAKSQFDPLVAPAAGGLGGMSLGGGNIAI